MKLLKGGNAALLLMLPLLLLGCSSTPPAALTAETVATLPGRELTDVEQLLLQAETAAPLAKAQYTLEAAALLLQQQQPQLAADLLNQLDPRLLQEPQRPRIWLLQAEAASQLQQPQQSLDWLNRISDPKALDTVNYQRYSRLRSDNNRLLGNIQATLLALIAETATAPPEQQAAMSQDIWSLLQQLDEAMLAALLARDNDYQVQGWLELTRSGNPSSQDILQLNKSLNDWLELWQHHSAANNLPDQLQQLRQFSATMPNHIGVLLPQSGKLEKPAKAVIEGMLAAHYQQLRQGRPALQISFFDSATIDDLNQFYTDAAQQQIDLIIGPLDKSRLSQLTQQASLPIPTLALNSVDSATTTLNLYQFGLRNEDEAIQSADRAWADGHRVAISLTPATTWGDLIRDTFARRWIELGGVISASERFTGQKDFSEIISRMVATDSSEARSGQLAQTLRQNLEFEPRRRQDSDFIFLAALNRDARQVKPILAFHYAGSLPVYATSHLFDGKPDKATYRDLNHINFNAMPWVIQQDNPLRASLSNYRDDTRSRFGRLYALGADSYHLAPYLAQLQALPEAHLAGQAGELTIDLFGQISRRQSWIKISNGTLKPLQP